MLKKMILAMAAVAGTSATALFVAWATSPDPEHNPATFEPVPITMEVARVEEALSFASYRADNQVGVLLVLGISAEAVIGVDVRAFELGDIDDPFAAHQALKGLPPSAWSTLPRTVVAKTQLLPAGPIGKRHIGIGTNFPEHAEESSSDTVFLFPKFGTATPPSTHVRVPDSQLLDYEVELCMRFDRPIATLEDFDAAVKGLFLCADFTDRLPIIEDADPDDLESAVGFSDAKSGVGFFPTGPLLVFPRDWQGFVAQQRMTTSVNGEPRQDARGGEMILDYRQLTAKILEENGGKRFQYKDTSYALTPADRIEPDMALMSGTSEGVIFTSPTRRDYVEMLLAYARAGGPLSGRSPREIGVPVFVANEVASGHFLQPGDVVHYQSTTLGDIQVRVVDD